MSRKKQPIMNDFPEHVHMNIEAAARAAERLHQTMPGASGCSGRCKDCWANQIMVIDTGTGFPMNLCFVASATRRALQMLVASKIE